MSKPLICGMPDLAGLFTPVMSNLMLSVVLGGAGSRNHEVWQYTVSYIRLIDKAIVAYRAARESLEEYVNSQNRTSLLLTSISHLETCIHSVKRALRFLGQLNRHPQGPPIPRIRRRLIESYGNQITEVRDAIEHMDKWIERGEVRPGEPTALMISEDGKSASIASETLSFDTLASALRNLHALAEELARYTDPVSTGPTTT